MDKLQQEDVVKYIRSHQCLQQSRPALRNETLTCVNIRLSFKHERHIFTRSEGTPGVLFQANDSSHEPVKASCAFRGHQCLQRLRVATIPSQSMKSTLVPTPPPSDHIHVSSNPKEHERQALMYEMLGRLMFCICVSDSCAVGLRMLRGSRGLGEQRQREEHAH